MTIPYIGAAGISSAIEAAEMVKVAPARHRILLLGILVSEKTLRGQTNRYPGRYPRITSINSIPVEYPRVKYAVHYHQEGSEGLAENLSHIAYLMGKALYAVQLNIASPDRREILRYKQQFPWHRIILQVRPGNLSAQEVAEYLAPYCPPVSDVLVDFSGGHGQPIDVDRAANILTEIMKQRETRSIGHGVAGGLSAKTLESIRALKSDFISLSIDAEGLLRRSDDTLDIEEAKTYIKKGFGLFYIPISDAS